MSITRKQEATSQIVDIQSDASILATGAVIALIGKLAGRGLQLLTHIILARLLGPAMYGLYAIGLSVWQIGSQIGLMGLDNGVIHFGGRAQGMNDDAFLNQVLRQSLILALLNGILVGGGIYLLAPLLAQSIFRQPSLGAILRGFALAMTFNVGLRVTSAATRLSRRMQFSVLAEDIAPAILNLGIIAILVILAKMSIAGALAAVSAGFGAGWFLAIYFLRRLFPSFIQSRSLSLALFRQLMDFSLPTFLAGMSTLLIQSSSILLIGYFLSSGDAGIYQAAAQISLLPAIILTAFNAIFAPVIPALYQSGQEDKLNELFKVSTKWGLYAAMPLFMVILFMPYQVMSLLYGEAYASGAWPLVILSLAQLVNAGTGAVGYLLIMTHHEKRWLSVSAGSFLLVIILNVLLVPFWGNNGAAVATGIGIASLFLISLFDVKRLLRLWPYDRRYFKGIVAALISAIFIFIFKWFLVDQTWWNLAITMLLSASAFIVVLCGLGIDDEEKGVWQAFWKAKPF